MWFNLKDGDYFHGGKNHARHDLTKYPHLSKLCTLVSSHEDVNKHSTAVISFALTTIGKL